MLLHNPGPTHPERPGRLRTILHDLRSAPIEATSWRSPTPAPRQALDRVHDPDYVSHILSLRGQSADLDPDTPVAPDSVDAALLAAGASINAVDALFEGRRGSAVRTTPPGFSAAVALVRPPGHHAEHDRAMGFCLFNNIAVAAAHARAKHNLDRVLIVDWDVHHGNGTQHLFESDPSILFISTHQFPFYPGTGAPDEIGTGDARGRTVNLPLPAGCDDADYAALFDLVIAPIADAFAPQLVLVSAGFDAHRGDPLGEMLLTAQGFAYFTSVLQRIADRHAGARIALFLEGGYHLEHLAASVRACIETLTGVPPVSRSGLTGADAYGATGVQAAKAALAIHSKFWNLPTIPRLS